MLLMYMYMHTPEFPQQDFPTTRHNFFYAAKIFKATISLDNSCRLFLKCLYVDPLLANEICFLLLIFLVALWGLLISGRSEWKSNNVRIYGRYVCERCEGGEGCRERYNSLFVCRVWLWFLL